MWNVAGRRARRAARRHATATLRFDRSSSSPPARPTACCPCPGWTLPGVFTLGGAQVALKFQGCAIGQRVVFIGTGPLLYLVAYQYAKAGVEVAAVLDTRAASPTSSPPLPAHAARSRRCSPRASYYVALAARAWRGAHGGVRRCASRATSACSGVRWRDGGARTHARLRRGRLRLRLRSETQLADLLGCRFAFDAAAPRACCPSATRPAARSVAGVYLAGDGAGIVGADAAEWAGERAALALLADLGVRGRCRARRALERKLARSAAFARGLERAFPFPQRLGRATRPTS